MRCEFAHLVGGRVERDGGEAERQQMRLGGEHKLVHVKDQVFTVAEQQEQVFEGLRQHKRVHPVVETGQNFELTHECQDLIGDWDTIRGAIADVLSPIKTPITADNKWIIF